MACKVIQWFGNIFHSIKVKVAPVVVSILEVLKGAEETGVADAISSFIDKALHTHVAEDINALVKKNIYNAIAAFLAIEGLPDNPTDDQIKAFVSVAVTALAGKVAAESIKGKVYQDFGIQLYDIVKKAIDASKVSGNAVTANQIAGDIEQAYQDYKNAAAEIAAQEAETAS
jgi:hypothetical protein